MSAEMENTQDEVSVERDDQVDDVSVKNKRRFKDVMKQFFSSKKKINHSNPLYSEETNANTPCSTKRPLRSQRSSDPCAKVSTV